MFIIRRNRIIKKSRAKLIKKKNRYFIHINKYIFFKLALKHYTYTLEESKNRKHKTKGKNSKKNTKYLKNYCLKKNKRIMLVKNINKKKRERSI